MWKCGGTAGIIGFLKYKWSNNIDNILIFTRLDVNCENFKPFDQCLLISYYTLTWSGFYLTLHFQGK